ncbi:RES family NAD+ phosphorylase [Sagittula salina]|uniref:RES family NAD+ phosphorylase n=1 Tax=Sagittula salina TaxID=2820268 RepID=A0A940MNQ8_9RHOB|nr:RES family NAD+ phosphorylase [Sagittula salina]MBP0482137.1 RES family NAD+ phosphorylase [Sagittula salina]
MTLENGRYSGRLYRALNPVYARDPLSGRGAERFGGRFNAQGVAALYTALDPVTALREANQVGDLQPTTLVSYRGEVGPVFDTRDAAALAGQGLTPDALADPGWRIAMLDRRPVPTQDFATRLIAAGYAGLLVRSFAAGARGLNMVLWDWPALSVIDDEDRLR